MERFSRLIIRYRLPIIIIVALITAFLAYEIRYLSFQTILESTLPSRHPYVEIHKQFREMFGGANVMLISLEAKEGDIFQPHLLKKIKLITDEIKFYDDAITAQVISISREKVKNIRGTAAGLDIVPFYKEKVPQTPQEIRELRENIYSNEAIRGNLVSWDGKAALILANFKEEMDYKKAFDFLQKTTKEIAAPDFNVSISGRPMLLGWVYENNPKSLLIFVISIIAELFLLFLFLSRFRWEFVPLPLLLGLLNAIWGLGVMGIFRFNLDPLGLVIPFVIGARVISHVIQITERYAEEYGRIGDRKEASISTIKTMFIPSTASIVTDAAGLYVLSLVPIPLLRTLGLVAGTWLLSAVVGVSILTPILFTYLRAPKVVEKPDLLAKGLQKVGRWLVEGKRSMGYVIGIWIVVLFVGVGLSRRVEIGDAHPGSSLLWPDSPYNLQDAKLNQKFPGTNPLYVIIAGRNPDALKYPDVLGAVEAFERHLWERCEEMGGMETLVEIVKKLNREFHEGDPKWLMVPKTKTEIAFYLWMYLTKGEPGDFDRYSDIPYQHGNIICYFKDHRGETIKKAIRESQGFLKRYPLPKERAEFKLAGGTLGVTAAQDEVVSRYNNPILFVALFIIFLCCVIPYRSLSRGFILLVSLITANFITMAYMALAKIGMTINVLPVAAIGAGLGVDYCIYMLSRIIDEMKGGMDIKDAIVRSFSTTGHAVVVTGLTVIAGIVFWYFSDLRFQAEMGFLLAFLLLVNVFGAIFLVTTLTYILRPGFIYKRVKK